MGHLTRRVALFCYGDVFPPREPFAHLLAGASGGTVTTRVDQLVRDSLIQIADVFDPTRQV
ncbi:MAG: hypothetical protein HYS33_07175 [Acidobacteria bacterium]|nr:hypothetical protein [Acidobacteriota bacterium]